MKKGFLKLVHTSTHTYTHTHINKHTHINTLKGRKKNKCFMSEGGEKRKNFFTTSLHRFAFYDSSVFMLEKIFVNV